MLITRDKFIQRTGHEPQDDDLERCNCKRGGEFGHLSCGWNAEFDVPQFFCGPPGAFTSERIRTALIAGGKWTPPGEAK